MEQDNCVSMKTERFSVRTLEAGINNQVRLSAICNYLQEISGDHADELGVGIRDLKAKGDTWMLSRLKLNIDAVAKWHDEVIIHTWAAGISGRVIALRDFKGEDGKGNPLFTAVSEWIYVNIKTKRIGRVPAKVGELVPPGAPRVYLPDMPLRFPKTIFPQWTSRITVRRCDQDFNGHVNNAHYVNWALEPLPMDWLTRYRVKTFDIQFRQSAFRGDLLRSEVACEEGQTLIHRIVRVSDEALLAQSRSVWKSRS